MSTGAIVAIIVVILIIAALLIGFTANSRRRRLRERFGPEYDRAVTAHESRREAEADLAQRERRVRELDIRPLIPAMRAQYSSEWTAVQEQFVDAPQAAVSGAQALVSAVMRERGYPTDTYDQAVDDLSVEHAATLDHFRAAHDISQRAGAGAASTEDLRQAMIHYRALFAELLGQPEASQPEASQPEASQPEASPPAPALAAGADAGAGERVADEPSFDPAADDAVAAPRRER